MTQNDLIYIENELNISIPDRYREIALNPILDKLKNSRFEPDILYSDPKKLVKANQRLRKNGIYGSEPLRSNHLIIGYSGFELYYIYIDVSEERKQVNVDFNKIKNEDYLVKQLLNYFDKDMFYLVSNSKAISYKSWKYSFVIKKDKDKNP